MNHHYRRVVRVLAMLALVGLVAVATGCTSGVNEADALNVNAITADPTAYAGSIAVKGVVQNVNPADSSIVLIDETEYATCGLTPCGSAGLLPLYLPSTGASAPGGSTYDGELPVLEDKVVIVGEIKSSPQGYYFDVERVERAGQTLMAKK